MKTKFTLIFFATIFFTRLTAQVDSLPPTTIPVEADTTVKPVDSLDIYDMTLEQLMNLKAHGLPSELEKIVNSLIAAASKKPLSIRESPSIVTLITDEEIKKSGARDLIDVLRMVPGMDFGMDVEGVVGLGMRGNWAHEGKVLLLLDGQEMNEILFATNQFGNHFPVDQIKKIEIIRGPGSAIYGGFAEYGVINIITKNGEDINGASVSFTDGQMKNSFARRNVNISAGKKINDFKINFSAFTGEGRRSDQDYVDMYGNSFNLGKESELNPTNFNLGMTYKGLSLRGIIDNYQTSGRDGYDVVKQNVYREYFNSSFAEIKYQAKVNDKLTITPLLKLKHQEPWKTPATGDTPPYFKTADRYTANITASYNITRKINFVFGAEGFRDIAEDMTDKSYYTNGLKRVKYFNQAYFAQGLIKHRIVNFIIGARYDRHNVYGDAFVPRVGLTKKYDRFHFKLLYSNSFRAPSIENINLRDSTGIHPEKTQVKELELGYQLTRASILTVNFYDITTKKPIVYYYDYNLNVDAYHNFGKSGTRGVEVEYRIKDKWGYANVNYAFYTVAGKDKIDDYAVPGNDKLLLAFASHKINLNSSFNIVKGLSISPSLSYMSKRYGYASVDSLGNSVLQEFKPVTLLNLFLNYNPAFFKGLNIGIGVYDLLDVKYQFIQPYNGYHAPMPATTREIIFKISYYLRFEDFKKENE